jgi:hypothetical protein
MTDLKQFIKQIGFPETETKRTSVTVSADKIKLLTKQKNRWTLILKRLDRDDATKILDSYPTLKKISFPVDFDVTTILYKGLLLSYQRQIEMFLRLKQNKIKEIFIDNTEENFRISKKILHISPTALEQVMTDARGVQSRGKSHRNSFETYEGNKLLKKYLNITVEPMTLVHKGDFNFLVDRLNLKTKKQQEDFQKYIDKTDIKSLQDLFSSFINHDIFPPDFLRKLNDYFIKEKLSAIIKLGRQLLQLKSEDIKTDKAKELVAQISPDIKVEQLETLWQRFFGRNLLYLIFTYQKIYPKVQLKITDDKKFPDFIGINHYGGVDIIEIKTHLTPALAYDKSHKNFAFSGDLSKAIIQSMNYVDALKHGNIVSDTDKENLEKENLYRPQTIIIISSSKHIVRNRNKFKLADIERDFTKLRNALNNIEIVTFDEILDTADRYQKNIIE